MLAPDFTCPRPYRDRRLARALRRAVDRWSLPALCLLIAAVLAPGGWLLVEVLWTYWHPVVAGIVGVVAAIDLLFVLAAGLTLAMEDRR